jgi:hypothetical protein
MPPDEHHDTEWWFAPLCPDDKHGCATGPTYWFCQCHPCRMYARKNAAKSRDNARHNEAILGTQTTVPTGDSPTQAGSRSDPAESIDRDPLHGSAADVDPVPAPSLGPAEYIAQLRHELHKKGLTKHRDKALNG